MPNLLSGSRIMQFLSRLGELILLNLCFLLCSLPIVTAGAAFAALYTVCTRFGTEREGATFRTFFRSFRENLKQGTLAWVLELILCAFSGYFALVFCFRGGRHPLCLHPVPGAAGGNADCVRVCIPSVGPV